MNLRVSLYTPRLRSMHVYCLLPFVPAELMQLLDARLIIFHSCDRHAEGLHNAVGSGPAQVFIPCLSLLACRDSLVHFPVPVHICTVYAKSTLSVGGLLSLMQCPWRGLWQAVVERKEEFWEKLFDSPEMWDAPLTDKGKEQCAGLAQQIDQEGADVDLIVVSPLTRTLQVSILMPRGMGR
jgi:hypothetical protein